MRWFKHLAFAHDDPALAAVLEQYGAEGYAVYWLMIEHIAAAMEPGKMDPSAAHTDLTWTKICCLKSVQKFHNIAAMLVKTRLIVCEDSVETLRRLCDNRVKTLRKVSIPNILKYRDEYSKKSGHSQDSRVEQIQIENRAEETPPTPSASAEDASAKPLALNGNGNGNAVRIRWFDEEFWPIAWAKIGKDASRAEWLLKAKTRRDADRIIAAAKEQGPDIMARAIERASREGGKPAPLHPRTWLHQGRFDDEPVLIPEPKDQYDWN